MGQPEITTLGQLKAKDLQFESVKDEMRRNLMAKIKHKQEIFSGIIGFENTVLPAIQNAILSRHNMIILGLRGQAKTRIARSMDGLLDEWTPVITGSPLNCHPLNPTCAYSYRLLAEHGDETPVSWWHRSDRYHEKLATPDVTMADLIGDIDPIKAAREHRDLTDEEVISFGIIPRSNRGIFNINELPDLQSRIQVGLLNILEENDLQIRGFPVRIPMDVVLVFTANPEDYTNRGNLITPLKDRIDSQIITHYPRSIEESAQITMQEAWVERGQPIQIPHFMQEVIESVAFVARESEYVDKSSGVSQRLTISLMENVISNLERRNLLTGDNTMVPRFADLHAAIAAVTGKIELAYEGEREGLALVASNIIGRAIKKIFNEYLPKMKNHDDRPLAEDPIFGPTIAWFAKQHDLEIADDTPFNQHLAALKQVPGLEAIALRYIDPQNPETTALAMEFILDGLHQENLLGKESIDGLIKYMDMLATLL